MATEHGPGSEAGTPTTTETTLQGRRLSVRRPWLPQALGTDIDPRTVEKLSYLTVEEVVGEVVALSVRSWPSADGHGRVRFAGAAAGMLSVHREEIRDSLYRGWRRRDPRVGDAFAVTLTPDTADPLYAGRDVVLDGSLRLADVVVGTIYDLSAEARTVAKLAYYASAAPVTPYDVAVDRGQDELAVRPAVTTATTTVRPSDSTEFLAVGTAPAPADAPWHVPAARLESDSRGSFPQAVQAESGALVYFLLNVGDGDSQVILLPADSRTPHRRALLVDVATNDKTRRLLRDLAGQNLLADPAVTPGVFPLVVATHPHEDHIGGLPELLDCYARAGQVGDFWEPGYYHPSGAFVETMALLEELGIQRTQPTSGTTRWVGTAKVTALAPGVGLRMRYDSYGVDINDASIALRVEFPAARVAEQLGKSREDGRRDYLRLDSPWAMVLGADAQTMSWAQVAVDFPELHPRYDTALHEELSAARGRDFLAAQVLKVSHHASKHGINLELMERIHPRVILVSSVGGGGRYHFPHRLAMESIREGIEPTTSSQREHAKDHDLGIHYTAATTGEGDDVRPLGSIALVVPPTRGGKLAMWRFGDGPRDPVDLAAGERLHPLYEPS